MKPNSQSGEESYSAGAEEDSRSESARSIDPKEFWAMFKPYARINSGMFGESEEIETAPVFLRPQVDDDHFPDPDDPDETDPCKGRPLVSPPLAAAQLLIPGKENQCPSEANRQLIIQAVRSQFSRLVPDAEVKVRCSNNLLTIAIWPSWNTGNDCEQKARNRGLNALDLIEGAGENFGFFLSSSLVGQQAQRGFLTAPRRLSSSGRPDPNGPIHLTGISVQFQSPDKVKTLVNGYDDRPWPDVSFTLTITDVLKSDRTCTTSSSLDTHGSWISVLTGILLGAATFFVPLLFPITFFVYFGDLDALINQPDHTGEGGVGCRALELIPTEIPLPGNSQLLINYRRSRVNAGGIFYGGVALPGQRQPTAHISGPSSLMVAENSSSTFAFFEVHTANTFGTVSVHWQGSTGMVISSPDARRTKITFNKGSNTSSSPPFTRTVRAKVTDQDGFAQNLALDVQISVEEDDGFPPVCKVKPYLPQCQIE